MMTSDSIASRLDGIRKRMHAAATAAGRDPATVRLLAVSKTFPPDLVRLAYAAGQRFFGENRVQELRDKAAALPPDCEWHLIGRLQANKCRPAVQAASWIHSVDNLDLLQRLDRIAGEERRRPVILLEINISGEASKGGAAPDHARTLAAAALRSPHLDLRGFMAMAPYGAPAEELRWVFGGLRELRDRIAAETGAPLPELSMGMSGDFEAAIAAGATIVRIGSAIFGGR